MIQPGVGYTYTNDRRGSSLLIDTVLQAEYTPFSVYEDSTAEGLAILRVTPGTINTQLPTVNGIQIGQPNAYLPAPAASSLVILTIPNSPTAFPSAQSTVSLSAGLEVPATDNDNARQVIASVLVTNLPEGQKSYTVYNLLTGSLSATRFINEVGIYVYFYSRI